MKADNVNRRIRIRFNDSRSMLRLKAILTYEADMSGRTLGQTVADLVLKSVDLDAYPEELLARIDEYQEQVEKYAIEKALRTGDEAE